MLDILKYMILGNVEKEKGTNFNLKVSENSLNYGSAPVKHKRN
jgi:hypothetical protein